MAAELDRRFIVEALIAGKWRRVNSTKWRGGNPTLLPVKRGRYGTHDPAGVVNARTWAARARYVKRLRVTLLDPLPFLKLDSDTRWPELALCKKLNAMGRALRRRLRIREGTRTRERQAQLYVENMNPATGLPKPGHPLTARPGTSNHEDHDGDGFGEAADVGVLPSDTNVGQYPGARTYMHAHGLCLPVPGETWHVEQGDRWRA